ncbi:zinc finger, C2H2 type, partial [Opisthorchis viverrini]
QTSLSSPQKIPAPETSTDDFARVIYALGEGDDQRSLAARSRTQTWEALSSHENPFNRPPVPHSLVVEQHRELFQAINRGAPRRFQCPYCGNVYVRERALKAHLRTCKVRLSVNPIDLDRKLLKCEYCDEVFPSKSRLKKHETRHLEVGTHKCRICCKAYKREHSLNEHMLRH